MPNSPLPTDLTTLAAVHAQLNNLQPTLDDNYLQGLISAASIAFMNQSGRNLMSATYTEQRNGNGGVSLVMRNRPVTAVASLTVGYQGGSFGAPFGAYGQPTIIPASNGIAPGYLFDVRSIKLVGYSFVRGVMNVTATYTAGYATGSPYILDASQAVCEMVAFLYKVRERQGLETEGLAPGQTTSYTRLPIPRFAQWVLNSYKDVAPVDD